ncbi:glucose 1-dehydrogenase [Phosphitispora sp. TUW77]|uniref:glucose 1-dehydrogenase n=1 Tax=Phosphitispora sp. TUW77 TaxID=3152361 RepID=UPI003AB7AFE3
MGKLDGKVAIITGGARGMGASHVRTFVAEGAKVFFIDILDKEGEALAAELGDNVKFAKLNVAIEEDWKTIVAEAEKAFGYINILVNNVGILLYSPIEAMSLEEYQNVINYNQLSVFLGMKYVLPSMKLAGNGSIINISSINGIKGTGNTAGYSSSKFAVRGLTQVAALEFAPYGIRVNSVHPGAIATPMILQEGAKEAIKQFAQLIPLKRVGKPEEVSTLVLFLASDDSGFCTGAEFIIDGGSLRT